MMPAYLERLPFIPTQVSNKVDREKLPAPKSTRLLLSELHAPPSTPTEDLLCRALSETLGLEEVSVDGDFFEEYGAHSLLMARFCAKVRQLEPSMHVAMRDVYTNPTVRRLARAIDAVKPLEAAEPEFAPEHRPSNLAYYGCGGAQTAFYILIGALGVGLAQASFEWTYAAVDSPLALYARALAVVAAWFFGLNALAIAAKWLLHRARPSAGPADLELRLFPLLGGQATRAIGAGERFRGNAALQCLSAPARGEDRAPRGRRHQRRPDRGRSLQRRR